MGKVKRYVLRVKGKVFLNKQCVEVLKKVVVPKMTSIRRDTFKSRKHLSWRDDLDYLWKYYKKYANDGVCDLRMYHEHRKCTYASSMFKQVASIQGYKRSGRVDTPAAARLFRRPGEVQTVPEPPRQRIVTAATPALQTRTQPAWAPINDNVLYGTQAYTYAQMPMAGRFDMEEAPTTDWGALARAIEPEIG